MLRPCLLAVLAVLAMLCSALAHAEARIQFETRINGQLQLQDVWIAPPKIRLNNVQVAGEYQIFDLQQGKHFVISEALQQVSEQNLLPLPQALKATLSKQGDGPRLQGFRTQQYRYSVGAQYCADLWLAYDWQGKDAAAWLESWRALPGIAEGDCAKAAGDAIAQLRLLGVPFKIADQQQLLFQVESLILNTKILPASFVLPIIGQQEEIQEQSVTP